MLSTIIQDLTLGDLLSGIPRDPGAIVAFALLGAFVAFIWIGSRSKGEGKRPAKDNGESRPTRASQPSDGTSESHPGGETAR